MEICRTQKSMLFGSISPPGTWSLGLKRPESCSQLGAGKHLHQKAQQSDKFRASYALFSDMTNWPCSGTCRSAHTYPNAVLQIGPVSTPPRLHKTCWVACLNLQSWGAWVLAKSALCVGWGKGGFEAQARKDHPSAHTGIQATSSHGHTGGLKYCVCAGGQAGCWWAA